MFKKKERILCPDRVTSLPISACWKKEAGGVVSLFSLHMHQQQLFPESKGGGGQLCRGLQRSMSAQCCFQLCLGLSRVCEHVSWTASPAELWEEIIFSSCNCRKKSKLQISLSLCQRLGIFSVDSVTQLKDCLCDTGQFTCLELQYLSRTPTQSSANMPSVPLLHIPFIVCCQCGILSEAVLSLSLPSRTACSSTGEAFGLTAHSSAYL